MGSRLISKKKKDPFLTLATPKASRHRLLFLSLFNVMMMTRGICVSRDVTSGFHASERLHYIDGFIIIAIRESTVFSLLNEPLSRDS